VIIGKWRKPVGFITGGLATLALASIAFAAPAYAQGTNICGLGGTGYCMNDWGNGGQNNAVEMYYGGYSNDYFYTEPVDACNGGDTVTGSCPFQSSTMDGNLAGDLIVQVVYANSGAGDGLCVGTASSGDAILTGCNNTTTGTGGGDGTLMVAATGSSGGSCDQSGEGLLVDRYWTKGAYAFVTSGGSIGAPLLVNDTSAATCWGGSGFEIE
jgi:hypothetical protein